MVLTLVAGIITLSVLVIVHELGHFIAAKVTHNYVQEFGIGFPPRIWGKKWGETIYSINWIPFGGFNKLSGEVDPKEPRALAARSHAVRLFVMSGGIIMNLLLPFVLLIVGYMVPHDVINGQLVVEQVTAGSPAEMAGIQVGDTIVSINNKPIRNISELSRAIQLKLGARISIIVKNVDGTTETMKLVPRWRPPSGQGAIGIAYQYKDTPVVTSESLFWKAVPTGAEDCINALVLYWNGIVGMINGTVPFVPAGPVGIVQVAGEVAHSGVSPLLELAAFISIAIAITQIIPFPALDGARIAFIAIEWARRGKRISARVENIVHSVGFIILLAVMVLITYQDLVRWITGKPLY